MLRRAEFEPCRCTSQGGGADAGCKSSTARNQERKAVAGGFSSWLAVLLFLVGAAVLRASAAVHHFDLGPVGSPQHLKVPVPLTVTARDAGGQIVKDYAGGVTLWATLTNVPWIKFDFEEGDFSQWTPLNLGNNPGPYEVVAFDVAGNGTGSSAFRLAPNSGAADGISRSVTLAGGVTYSFYVDIASANENGGFANGDPGTAHLQINGQEIATFSFGVFGQINPLQVMRTNLAGAFTTSVTGTYQMALLFDRGYGQAEVWNYADNVRITAAPLRPTWVAPFTNGTWSGGVPINFLASGLRLLAEDPQGNSGASEAFEVEPSADLALQMTNTPGVVRAGSDVTFAVLLTNRGPSTATSVRVTNRFDGDVVIRSAANNFGSATIAGNVVIYEVGILTNGRLVTLTAIVKPHSLTWFTNSAMSSSAVFDPEFGNNAVSAAMMAELPAVHIDTLAAPEGNGGTNLAQVPVWLEGPVGHTVSVEFAARNGTAIDGFDFLATSGTIVLPPEVTTQYVQVAIIGDTVREGNETVSLMLSNAANAVLVQPTAVLSITDDDPLPVVSIADTGVIEGNSGSTGAVFEVTLANPSSSEVRVAATTAYGSATNSDFAALSGTVIFPAGSTSQTFTVTVNGDTLNEPDQVFFVGLTVPVNCVIGRGTATGTITNDDAAPGRILRFAIDPPGSPQYRGRGFPLTVRALDHLGNPATTFNSTSFLSAKTDGVYVQRIREGFEDGDTSGWTNYGSASLVVSNVGDVAASGARSLRLTGKASSTSQNNSLRCLITNSRPNKVSFSVRAGQTNAITGRMWLYGMFYRAFDFCMNKDGRMGFNTSSGLVGVPYVSNQWYRVDIDLNWATNPRRVINCSIDGVPVVTNLPFLDDVYPGAEYLALQNSEIGTSWFDDIHVYDSYPSNLVIAPTAIGPFSGGVWNGSVTISQSASNAYVSVTDNAEHMGETVRFDVLTAGLKVLAPVAVAEGAGAVPAQVAIPVSFSQNLVIGLTSSAPAELTVPTTVTIPAGQTNATFNLNVVNDTQLDGSQLVVISAGNTNLTSGSTVVSVDDDETTTVSLVLPTAVAENAGVVSGQAQVTLGLAPAKAVAVRLSSSNTNWLRVPPTVTVAAGQVAAGFSLTVTDNAMIDGDKQVNLDAAVTNWTGGSGTIAIVDNEDAQLRLSGPSQLSEETGTAVYTARISGWLPTNLVVSIGSTLPGTLSVPMSATILAGTTNATFAVALTDNALYDGAKVVGIGCAAPGFAPVTNSVTVLDNEIHHLGFSAINGTVTSSVPFNVTVSARDILDGPSTGFSGEVTLAGAGPQGACLVQPSSINLVNGSWAGQVTVYSADTEATLQAATTGGLTGTSGVFPVVPPSLLYVNVAGGDLVYSPASQRLWALVGSSSMLVPINPFNGSVEPAVSAGPGAGRIATSSDGRYLHIVGSSSLAVRRFDTFSRTLDLTFTNNGLTVMDLAVSPTNSDLVAISWACPGCSPQFGTVYLYEGGVRRTNAIGATQIEFGDAPGELFWHNADYSPQFGVARVEASGLSARGTLPILSGWTEEFNAAGGRLFSRYGGVYDQRTFASITSGNGWWNAPADKIAGRLYTVWYYTIGPIAAYDLETMLPVGTVNLPGPFSASAVTLWGTNGVAFCASSKVIVARTSLRPTAPYADLAISTVATNWFAATSNTFRCAVTVSNFGTNAASKPMLAVRLPSNVSVVSAACSSGLITNQAADAFVCAITNLPAGSATTVDMTLRAGMPGVGGARIGLTQDNVDFNRSNNTLYLNFHVGTVPGPDTVTELRQATIDLAWSSNAARILMAVDSAPLTVGASLLMLDPTTMRFEEPIPTGFGPNKLSVHPAGRYVYAGLDRETAITRIDLVNRVADLKFLTGYNYAADVAAAPDNPARVAATVHTRVVVYENGMPLPNTVEPTMWNWDYFLEFGSTSADRLYCAFPDGFRRIQVDNNGATLIEDVGGLISGYDRDMRCDGGRVFTAGGRVFDGEVKTNIAALPYGGLVVPDSARDRVFYLNGSGASYNLICLTFTNLQLVGSIAITNVSGSPTSLIRWGPDGLAFRTTGGQVYLVRTAMADDSDLDGLADAWELQHFGLLNAPQGGAATDPDGDGLNNLAEYRSGTDPLVSDPPRFTVFSMEADGMFRMGFFGPPGNYSLLGTTNLVDWAPVGDFTITVPPVILSDPFLSGPGTSGHFYRVIGK